MEVTIDSIDLDAKKLNVIAVLFVQDTGFELEKDIFVLKEEENEKEN